MVLCIGIPALVVLPSIQERAIVMSPQDSSKIDQPQLELSSQPESKTEKENIPNIEVSVYRSDMNKIDTLPLESYLIGVVAAEMPATFELEALKAQAMAARTYTMKQLLSEESLGVPKGADVTDTVMHQVYYDNEQLKDQWGETYGDKYAKIAQAVRETSGQIITHNGTPITASFFSTSNGYTENSEDYWPNAFPYLRSVESPWDKNAPRFIENRAISVAQFEESLNVKLPSEGVVGEIISRTDGKRVEKVNINGTEMSGRDVREALQLRSSDFSWERDGDVVQIETKGYGHGVGMSQYGANGMAASGKNYKDILAHYYQDTVIEPITTYALQLQRSNAVADNGS
ncbi:stage II sporulation protein D [Bacillaceae bacterium SIJ1]|nr:stage II sporulation protein D [Litoribacterium kuwaitense]